VCGIASNLVYKHAHFRVRLLQLNVQSESNIFAQNAYAF